MADTIGTPGSGLRPQPASMPAPPPGGVPGWAVVGIFILLAIGALAFARAFMMPTVLAFLLALVFSPVRRWCERLGLGPVFAAFAVTGALLALTLAAIVALAGPISEWVADAQAISREIEWKLRDLRGIAAQLRDAASQIDEIAAADAEDVQRVVVQGPSLASSLAFSTPGVLAQALFTLVLLFFLIASGDMFYEKVVAVLPNFRDKRRAVRIARDIERKLSRYLFTITAINAGLGIAIGLAMWAAGMPQPALFGALAFLLNYIPYVGSVVGVSLAAVVGLVTLPTAWDAMLAVVIYFSLTAIEGQLITPLFVGRNLALNTVVVFLSVTFWAWLWSVVGMLVATPLLVAVKVFCEHIPALEPVGTFLSARGAERSDEEQEDPP